MRMPVFPASWCGMSNGREPSPAGDLQSWAAGMATNAELLLTAYEAWNRDDCDAWLELLDPDVEVHTSGVFPDLAAVYRGHRRAAKFWRQMREPWETFRIDVERIEEEGDAAMAAVRFRARGADSGLEVDMRFANAIRVRDGLATQLVNRRTLEEARDALGPGQEPAPSSGEPERSDAEHVQR
jgi:ketosteroid isomerase-like protein